METNSSVCLVHLPVKTEEHTHQKPHSLQDLHQVLLAGLVLLHRRERLREQREHGALHARKPQTHAQPQHDRCQSHR